MSHPDPRQSEPRTGAHVDPSEAPRLMADTMRSMSNLMQTEVELAKAEVSRNITRAGIGIAFFVIAAVLAITALQVLVGALVAYITLTGLSAGTSALIVGGALLLVALVLVLAGKARLSAKALEPTRTVNNLQRDLSAVKGATHA